jgi:hypothetical protein
MSGWQPYNPTPPNGQITLNINDHRRSHVLKVVQDNGTIWTVGVQPGFEWETSGYFVNYPRGVQWLTYFHAVAPIDVTTGFFVVDESMNESTQWFPPGVTGSIDLTQWFGAPSPLLLNVRASRWNHNLCLMQSNGETFPIVRGNLQGLWFPMGGVMTFTPTTTFVATTSYHPELDYWIYDISSGETSAFNTTQLAHWQSARESDDTDQDRLPDWYEFMVGTNINSGDSDGDGLPDYDEFEIGADPLLADTDGDGLLDRNEGLFRRNPRKKDHPLLQLSAAGFTGP